MGYVTSEKQQPSALDLLGAICAAISVERRQGPSKPLKDMLAKCIGAYNAMVTNRRHRIDTNRKTLLYNLRLGLVWRASLV